MSDYVPCDGCSEEATHHLCEECCNEPTEYERGIAEGERRERAAVVKYLGECVKATYRNGVYLVSGYVEGLVESVEAGEHKEPT